jgi:rfaE bifunctional protein nucleotidyltransferase chain/domain
VPPPRAWIAVVGPGSASAQQLEAAEEAGAAIAEAGAVLVSDYGRGVAAEKTLRRLLAAYAARGPLVWDPHVCGAEPVRGAALVTPNRGEAEALAGESPGSDLAAAAGQAHALRERWGARAVVITMGAKGAMLVTGRGSPVVVPPARSESADSCGAGDRFAAACLGMLARGELLPDVVAGAVAAATTFVRDGGAGGLRLGSRDAAQARESQDALELARSVRARGGIVVATGGCFDLLHAGHVSTLRAARALGDCLIVCLNSDRSVRALKGDDRPIVTESERAEVLLALECVDAVEIFDEDTPLAVLERLQPDVFAKGGDYADVDIPEAKVVERWGGQLVILPYLEGRSTTRLIEELAYRGA